jgi:hypothetical protein
MQKKLREKGQAGLTPFMSDCINDLYIKSEKQYVYSLW